MNEEILAMCRPKVIDLDKYGLSDIILSLFAQGGGQYASDVPTELWKELRGDNRVYIAYFTVPSMDLRFMTSSTAVVKSLDEIAGSVRTNFHFELTAVFETAVRISVMISERVSDDGTEWFSMTVKVNPI